MDISVSQLNKRLALQLPAELPLGLVFVAGEVNRVSYDVEDDGRVTWATFDLEQEGYLLRCRLSFREGEEVHLDDGAQVRLGGHLTFDAQHAQYFLLARDVELLGEMGSIAEASSLDLQDAVQDEAALLAALASIKRRSEVAQQTSDLPIWVQKLAPIEVQDTLPYEDVDEGQESRMERRKPQLNEEIVAYLSSAMESEEDLELTPELLADLLPDVDQAENGAVLNDEVDTTAVTDDDAVMNELQAWSDSLAGVGEEVETAVQPYDPVKGEQVVKPKPKAVDSASNKSMLRPTDMAVLLLLVLLIVIAFVLIYAIYNAAF